MIREQLYLYSIPFCGKLFLRKENETHFVGSTLRFFFFVCRSGVGLNWGWMELVVGWCGSECTSHIHSLLRASQRGRTNLEHARTHHDDSRGLGRCDSGQSA